MLASDGIVNVVSAPLRNLFGVRLCPSWIRFAVAASMGCFLVTGCGLVVDFPDIPGEFCLDRIDDPLGGTLDCRDSACGDQIDNDGDGDVDCHDSDCVGACIEICDDGPDNDLDGLRNGLDPHCWLSSGIKRCATIEGRTIELDVEQPVVPFRTEDDPTGQHPHVVWRTDEVEFDLEIDGVSTGDLGGLAVTSTIFMDPREVSFEVSIAGAVGPGTAGGSLTMGLYPDDLPTVRLASPTAVHGPEPFSLPAPGATWIVLRLRTEPTALRLTISSRGSELAELEVPSLTWPLDIPLSIRVRGWREGATDDFVVLIAGLRVSRPDRNPCGHPIPALRDPDAQVIFGAAQSPETECILVGRPRAGPVMAYRAVVPTTGTEVPFDWRYQVTWQFAQTLGDPSLAWDYGTAVFRAVATRYEEGADGLQGVDLVMLHSQDCQEWKVDGSLLAPEDVGRMGFPDRGGNVYGYSIVRPSPEQPPVHEVFVVTERDGEGNERGGIVRAVSASGAPGSFRLVGEAINPGSVVPDLPLAPDISISRVGRKLVSVAPMRSPGPGWIGFHTRELDRLARDPGGSGRPEGDSLVFAPSTALLWPSGVPNAFDAAYVEQAVLTIPVIDIDGRPPSLAAPRLTGRLYYSARPCRTCDPEIGVAIFTQSRGPF